MNLNIRIENETAIFICIVGKAYFWLKQLYKSWFHKRIDIFVQAIFNIRVKE